MHQRFPVFSWILLLPVPVGLCPDVMNSSGLEHVSRRPCVIFFNRTLREKIQVPPTTLHDLLIRINRTLHEIFQADLAQKISSRPWLQKGKQICLNQKPRKCLHVAGKSGKSTRPCMKIFRQTLLEVRLSRPCVKFFNRTLLENF